MPIGKKATTTKSTVFMAGCVSLSVSMFVPAKDLEVLKGQWWEKHMGVSYQA